MSLLTVRFTKSGVAGIGRRHLQEVGRKAIAAAGMLWWTRYLKLHFMKTAFFRYGYDNRRSSYEKWKLKPTAYSSDGVPSAHEDKPLVFTGRSRESATSAPHIVSTAKNFRTYNAEVILNVPVLNFIPRLREDLIYLIPPEIRQMEKEFGREFEVQLVRKGRTLRTTKTYRAAA